MPAVICPNCGFVNSHGALFCHKCYALLLDTIRTGARGLPVRRATVSAKDRNQLQGQRQSEANQLPAYAVSLYLLSAKTPTSNPLVVLLTNPVILGRSDGNSEQMCINLSSYGAAQYGVSRQHLVMKYDNELTIEDMGSSNGTWLNDAILQPYQSAVVESGSQLRLGKFLIEIYTAE